MCVNSKMVYLYKAVPISKDKNKVKWMRQMQKELDEIWKKHFGDEIRAWWRIPIKLYGIGLFNISDRRSIARQTFERKRYGNEDGANKEEVWRAYYMKKMEKWKKKKRIPQIDASNLPAYVNTSLISPPFEHSMKLDNLSFRMLIDTRYCSGGLDIYKPNAVGKKKCKCSIHNEPWTFQHVISCPLSCMQAARSQHDQLTQYICGILLRSHKVENVCRERKTLEQEQRMREGVEAKRADITYWLNGKQHSLDISVTTSWSKAKWRNPISDAQRRKEKEYGKEENVHIILFDTSGCITANAWKLLEEVGATTYDIRRMQTIIHRTNAKKYQVISAICKNEVYKGKRRGN